MGRFVLGEENVFHVELPNRPTPPPPFRTVLGVTSQTPFTYLATVKDLNFVQGGWGKNLVNAVLVSVYCRLAANSMKKGRCTKTFWPGL